MSKILQHKYKRLVLACTSLVYAMMSFAYSFTSNGLYYDITSSTDYTVTVTYKSYSSGGYSGSPSWYTDCSGTIVIPSAVSYGGITYTVTSIAAHAFDDSNITSVVIPNTVTSIGDYAFAYSNLLTSISIPSSVVSIGDGTFVGTGITSPIVSGTKLVFCPSTYQGAYHIPMGITEIGDNAFSGCTGLTNVIIPHGTTTIGSSAFSGCTSLTAVSIPSTVTTVGQSAFSGCSKLESVVLPNNATYIGEYNQEIKGETNVEIIPVIA